MSRPFQIKNDDQELKYLAFKLSLKEVEQDDEKYFKVEGYASTFNNEDRGGDIVMPGAFSTSIKELTPMLLWSHNHDRLIGKIDEIFEDSKGLFIRARCPREDSFVKGHVIPQVDLGSVASMSIGYYPIVSEYDRDDEVRRLKEVKLFEVSLVPLPMNPRAVITSAKSLDISAAKEIKSRRDFERALRDLGVSKSAAVYLASRFDESPGEPEPDGLDELKSMLDQLGASIKSLKEENHA